MPFGAFNPIAYPQDQDAVVLQGVQTPGLAKVGEFKRVVDFDIKVGRGTAGATETVKGLPPAEGSIDFFAWTEAHFDAWDVLLPLLRFDPTKKTKQANAIYHPNLHDIGVDSVNIKSIGSWVEQSPGYYKRTMEFVEFAPAVNKNAAATPQWANAGSPGAKTGTSPDPATKAAQKEADAAAKDAAKAYS